MALTNQDVVEGYFQDYNNRLARENAARREQDQMPVSFSELAQGAGQIALGEAVELQ